MESDSGEKIDLAYTVVDNIRIWLVNIKISTALIERIRQTVEQENTHLRVEAIPDGYHVIHGEGNMCASGGQEQRVFIGRNISKKLNSLIFYVGNSFLYRNYKIKLINIKIISIFIMSFGFLMKIRMNMS